MGTYPTPNSVVNGRGIRHRHLTRYQRAHLAADLATGALMLYPLGASDACRLLNASPVLVREHLNKARRADKPHNGGNGNSVSASAETLAEHLVRSTPAERSAAATVLGAATVWDEMIVPLIAADRAAG
jgi:hypothetical protein